MTKRRWVFLHSLLALLCLFMLGGCGKAETASSFSSFPSSSPAASSSSFSYDAIPEYAGDPYVVMNDNVPYFQGSSIAPDAYERYGAQDALGRCTAAMAVLGRETMPEEGEERTSLYDVRPTGWTKGTCQVDEACVSWRRCHLISWQLSAENANPLNLITGTEYMDHQGMLGFENEAADYIHATGNHVAYRVTPVFVRDEMIARGVLMEGWSIEDQGQGVCFCVFCYNVSPGVSINYVTGETAFENKTTAARTVYVLNTRSKKFHAADCPNVSTISDQNRQIVTVSRDDLIARGYSPASDCDP